MANIKDLGWDKRRRLAADLVAASTSGTSGTSSTGGIDLSTPIQLIENAPIIIAQGLTADGKYSGLVWKGTLGTAGTYADLCYQGTSGKWHLTDADAEATIKPKLGFCCSAGTDGMASEFLFLGDMRADALFPTLVVGERVYASGTAGKIQTAACTSGQYERVVGEAYGTKGLSVNISREYYLIA